MGLVRPARNSHIGRVGRRLCGGGSVAAGVAARPPLW